MKHLIAAVTRTAFADPRLKTHCGLGLSEVEMLDQLVFEAALSDCQACCDARQDALHNVRPKFPSGSIPDSLTKDGSSRPFDPAKSPGGLDGARGPGDTGRVSRGDTALLLLKEMVRAGVQHGLGEQDTDAANDLWRRVRELLAEDAPGSIKPPK